MKAPRIYIVVPCYNEEQVLPDDGSGDQTWAVIQDLTRRYGEVEGLKLAHNAGHQNALWAGMMTVKDRADAVITIDADLQDDVEAIPQFLQAYREGCQVVYGVRSQRKTDTAFKRNTAHWYYALMGRLGGVHPPPPGLIGPDVGKIYTEVKHRPRYILETYLDKPAGASGGGRGQGINRQTQQTNNEEKA